MSLFISDEETKSQEYINDEKEATFITNMSYLKQPYSSTQSILILGEQDFSLSLAIKKKYNPKIVIATAYYQEPPKQAYWENIEQLAISGCIVKFKVDAINLESSLIQAGVDQKYDRIIFTFPRSSKLNNDEKNRQFIIQLCENAIKCLKEPNGQLHLLLHFNEKHLQSQYHHWKISEINDWIQINQLQFDMETIQKRIFPGYQPKTENGKKWKPRLPVMCLMKPDFEVLHKRARQKQIQSDFEMAWLMSSYQQSPENDDNVSLSLSKLKI
eukprot:21761_1